MWCMSQVNYRPFIHSLSDEELMSIMQCDKSQDLYNTLDKRIADTLYSKIQEHSNQISILSKHTQALFIPITDASNYPMMFLWGIIGLVSMGTLSVVIGTLIMVATSLIVGGFFFHSNYLQLLSKENKLNHFFQLYNLKDQCADLYMERKNIVLSMDETPSYIYKNKMHLIKDSIRSGLLVSSTLFGTYFLGFHGIFTALNLTPVISATLGPWGIIVGLVVALGAGIYFGAKQFYASKQEDEYKFEKKCLKALVHKKKSLCDGMSKEQNINEMLHKSYASRPIYNNSLAKITTITSNSYQFKLSQFSDRFLSSESGNDSTENRFSEKLNKNSNY